MRRAPDYTPEVGMVVRRRAGELHAGRLLIITSVHVHDPDSGICNIRGIYAGSTNEVPGDAEKFEPLVEIIPAPGPTLTVAAEPTFRVGQEAIVSDRVRDAADDHDCEVLYGFIGTRVTITEILEDGRVRFSWNGGDHEWQCLPRYLDVAGAPAPVTANVEIFNIGERVEIIGREADLEVVSAPVSHIGLVGTISCAREVHRRAVGGYWQRVHIEGRAEDASSAYWYPIGCLRRLTDGISIDKPLNFDTIWRFAQRGTQLRSLMDYLWEWLGKPIDSLSRARGDWNQLVICRAVLRLRRSVPNSYEEQLVKGQLYTSSQVWERVWAAVFAKR